MWLPHGGRCRWLIGVSAAARQDAGKNRCNTDDKASATGPPHRMHDGDGRPRNAFEIVEQLLAWMRCGTVHPARRRRTPNTDLTINTRAKTGIDATARAMVNSTTTPPTRHAGLPPGAVLSAIRQAIQNPPASHGATRAMTSLSHRWGFRFGREATFTRESGRARYALRSTRRRCWLRFPDKLRQSCVQARGRS